jgi:chaperonin GroEL
MVTDSRTTKQKLIEGVNEMANVVKSTLGTKGRLICYTDYVHFDDHVGKPMLTKDGVTVAKHIRSKDPVKNQAMKILRQAAKNTVSSSGDGPQPLYAKVLTPEGFVKMGDLKPNHIICGTNGTTQIVEAVFPKGEKEIYEVEFSDGRIVQCCKDHTWNVTTYNGINKNITVDQMLQTGVVLHKANNQKQYRYYTPKSHVDFSHKHVDIDPYFLGLLIGNGSLSENGDIELSLGINKEHVIKNIPKHIKFICNFVEDKNYFRIKFKSPELKGYLESYGLYETTSSTKFIPKNYLYNSLEVRQRLLEGLLETDCYINKRDLFEYSTVSDELSNNFIELVRSLGYSVNYRVHNRNNDPNFYSDKPIHKITQLKGYKYGDKIVNIRSTGVMTEMQCIKVSNEDSLYITDNYIQTHNTTSTLILSQYLINEGFKLLENGMSSWQLNKEMDHAVEDIHDYIKKNSIDVYDDLSMLKELASISANDPEIGEIIYSIIDELGVECDIEVKLTKRSNTSVEIVNGMKLHKGYFDAFMCNDFSKMTFEANNVFIIVYDGVLKDYQDIAPYVKAAVNESGEPSPVLVYAKDVSKTTITRIEHMMKHNPRPFMIVEHDGFGDRRIAIMNDLATMTGAYIISPEDDTYKMMDHYDVLGFCDEVIVDNQFTSIIGAEGDEDEVTELLEEIRKNLEVAMENNWIKEIKFINKRIANLIGGIAVIHVGGNTEFSAKEKYDRIDDAVLAMKAAIKKGISIGGAFTWERTVVNNKAEKRGYNKKDNPGYFMVYDSLKQILNQLLINSGEYTEEYANEIRKSYTRKNNPKPYNLIDRSFYNLEDYKVYDATSVLLDSIYNACSVSKSILSIEYSIHNYNQDG